MLVRAMRAILYGFRGSPWMLWYAVGLHYFWASALAFNGKEAEGAVILVGIKWLSDIGFGPYTLAALLSFASTLALVGLLSERKMRPEHSFLLVLPQFLLMISASLSDSLAVINGGIEGRSIDRLLLVAALGPLIWAGILHTVAILDRYGPGGWLTVWPRQLRVRG